MEPQKCEKWDWCLFKDLKEGKKIKPEQFFVPMRKHPSPIHIHADFVISLFEFFQETFCSTQTMNQSPKKMEIAAVLPTWVYDL
mmetsp:Transcript_24247/g.38952  ORF Transcript_24247/g.38952 Transcript_24247/m.38952 type:complete len:84 (-) Transcript_24247:350-601(-)